MRIVKITKSYSDTVRVVFLHNQSGAYLIRTRIHTKCLYACLPKCLTIHSLHLTTCARPHVRIFICMYVGVVWTMVGGECGVLDYVVRETIYTHIYISYSLRGLDYACDMETSVGRFRIGMWCSLITSWSLGGWECWGWDAGRINSVIWCYVLGVNGILLYEYSARFVCCEFVG